MPTEPTPHKNDPRCPRCDEVLTVARVPHGPPRGLTFACPELYCDYVWSPTERELARLRRAGESDVTRAAG